VPDPRAVMPGRGAYLCLDGARKAPARACLELALSRGGIPRALRRNVRLDSLTARPEPVESEGR
jgi:predicted RNA-binding protein YlxR (DUF448 family)